MIRNDLNTRAGGRHDTLNPYRVAARLILDRIRWDLQPSAWRSRRKLRALRNLHWGKKAVILCNGPSLRDVDLDQLNGVFTFGLNKINLLFEESSFRPSVIVAVNPLVIEQNRDFYSQTEIPLFLDGKCGIRHVLERPNIHYLHSSYFPYFSRDCSFSVFQGYTVTYVALQLAYHMGFRKVALVGCDHDYGQEGEANQVTLNVDGDRAHFCQDYFSSNEPWQFPDLVGSEYYYDIAKRCYAYEKREIVNASTRTRLGIFPRKALREFLSET